MPSGSSRRHVLQAGAGLFASTLWSPANAADEREAEERRQQPKLKITAVKTYRLRHRLKRPSGASVSVPLPQFREALLVKIETNSGVVGWGETEPISGARGALEDHIAPRLIGRNPLEYRKLWREMWGANFGNALAIGAVDTALNDIRGKALNLPIAELFGGRFRDRVPVYVSALNYVNDRRIEDEYPEVAAKMVAQGHRAIKMRVGRYSVAREARVVSKVREVVGPLVKLLADGNAAYTMGSAIRMGHALHDAGFEFFEEPLPQSPHYAAYEELRQKLPLPLAAGEVLDSRATAKQLIDRRCMDIIQPDLSLCGGIGEALFVAEMAALSGIRCMPHCWGGAIVIAASTHLLSLLPDPHWGRTTDTPMLEIDQGENPWREELVTNPFTFRNGLVDVPTKPGLGIDVNEDVVRKYAV